MGEYETEEAPKFSDISRTDAMDAEVAVSGVTKEMEKDLRLQYGIDEESEEGEEDDEDDDLIEEVNGLEEEMASKKKAAEEEIELLRKEVEQSVSLAKVDIEETTTDTIGEM